MRALLVFLFACAPLAAAAGNLTALIPANAGGLQASSPASIEVLSLSYPPSGVVEASTFESFGTASSELSSAGCGGPSPCTCEVDAAEFSCSFAPPVGGTYSLELATGSASATYYLELHPGRQVRLTSVQEAEPASNRYLFYAMAVFGLAFLAYLAYAAYRKLTRKRRSVKNLLQKRLEAEHDMEALRYRYMKREIDEITLAQLMQQKKLELIQINSQISQADDKSVL